MKSGVCHLCTHFTGDACGKFLTHNRPVHHMSCCQSYNEGYTLHMDTCRCCIKEVHCYENGICLNCIFHDTPHKLLQRWVHTLVDHIIDLELHLERATCTDKKPFKSKSWSLGTRGN